MITIIHGEDTASSRTSFISKKSEQKDAVSFNGETVSLTALTQVLEGGGLFDEEKHIYIEDLLSKRKKSEEAEQILKILQKHEKSVDITLWESKSLSKTVLSHFSKPTVYHFDLPKSLFEFLDSLLPENGKTAVQLFHKTIATTDIHIVVFMIIRHIRLLLALKEPSESSIDEVKRMSPWQSGKMAKQAKAFSLEKLIWFHKALFEIDLSQKTGKSALTLEQSIDFLLLEI